MFRSLLGMRPLSNFSKIKNKRAAGRNIKTKGKVFLAKSSENYTSIKKVLLGILESFSFLDGTLDELTTTRTSFRTYSKNNLMKLT